MRANEFLTELRTEPGGWGEIPNNKEIDYFGIRAQMSRNQFFKLAYACPQDQADIANIKVMADREQAGGTFAAPMLYILIPDDWREGKFDQPAEVKNHEGRHRVEAHALLYGPTDPMEIHIIGQGARKEWRNRYGRDSHYTAEVISGLNQQLINQYGKLVSGPFFKYEGGITV